MAYSIVASRIDQSTDGNGYTSGSLNTTGATLLVVAVTDNGSGAPVVTDSYSNVWTKRTPAAFGGTDAIAIWDAKSPTVGSGHTISVSGTTVYPSSIFVALGGADTSSPFDQENGGFGLFPPMAPGSVTPTTNDQIILTAMRNPDGASTIDLSYTILHQAVAIGGQNTAIALAYLIQTTAAASAPTWQTTAFGNAAVIASYKAGAGGGGGGNRRRRVLMAA